MSDEVQAVQLTHRSVYHLGTVRRGRSGADEVTTLCGRSKTLTTAAGIMPAARLRGLPDSQRCQHCRKVADAR